MQHYPDIDPNPDFASLEEKVLKYWQEHNTFTASVEARSPQNEFVFYDGPPFANGLPHYGHLLTGFVKDAFARYQTQTGKRVDRRFGWDCHGLPAEMGSEKELGISGRQAIQHFGIGKFNEHCRTSVMKYTHEWEYYVNRQARWVDFQNDYKTMDTNFMESVLWAFKQLHNKGLIYEAYRVMPYSWAAETPLSNFETKLDNSYRERKDPAVYIKFEISIEKNRALLEEKLPHVLHDVKDENFSLLAWTTTPWTLPSNLALAVNIDAQAIEYVLAKTSKGYVVATKKSIQDIFKDDTELYFYDNIAGWQLLNLQYEPLFPYFANHPNAFRILDGTTFVTDTDGTGIVHMAPGFGEDDQKCCEDNKISLVVPVDGQGKYTDEIFDIDGLSLKGENVIEDHVANKKIIKYLEAKGHVINVDWNFTHNYPHCWRTDKPLIYRAMPSWYVEVTRFRDRAVELNKKINWIPTHVRDGQMGHMLATAPDWSISRNRFWGTPIPVWRGDKGGIKAFGSITELEAFFGQKVEDLHRPYIDTLTKTDEHGETWKRVEDVFDCWFESGSMPFAQAHYPFENREWFENHFPADFITEYVGQTRGWFNTLIMLSTALFDKPPFLNCICHGVVLDAETGLKYSKRLKNYKDPKEVMDQFGADALRWLMLSSPVMRGADISVDPEGKFIRDVVRLHIKPIWNAFNFFCLYANADGIKATTQQSPATHLLDRYILLKCRHAVEQIRTHMDAYDTPGACEAIGRFFEVLNNWYIRRNKERFWKQKHDADKQAAYDTLYTVLVLMCRAGASLLPLTLEEIHLSLTKESVHLQDFPDVSFIPNEPTLTHEMDRVRDICNAALSVRNKVNIRVRQPLAKLLVVGNDTIKPDLQEVVTDEVNVKIIREERDISHYATYKLSLNNQVLGKRLPALMKQIIPAAKKGEWTLQNGAVTICGETLQPEEYVLQLEPKPEYASGCAALSSNDALVILDTQLTPELINEGIARDAVRLIQQARKDSGLHVADRIHLTLHAPDYEEALKAHTAYIAEQTLSTSVTFGEVPHATKNEIDGKPVAIALSKA